MSIEIAYVVAGTMIFTGFIVGGGIIYSGLKKVADALIKKGWITLSPRLKRKNKCFKKKTKLPKTTFL